MKRLLLGSALVLVTSCNQPITDPVGEPFRISLQVAQPSAGSTTVNMTALVDYGPMGGVPATVEFLDDSTVLGSTSEREPLVPDTQNPWDYKFQKQIELRKDTDYNLKARIRWTSKGVEKTLTSDVVKFRIGQP